jgi:mannose-6-phosphate isomerase-like protein (cupin superfamily)
MQNIRRVITGIDEQGRSTFLRDETIDAKVPPLLTGNQILELFGSDETPTVPSEGTVQEGLRFFPTTPQGFRFVIFTYPPDSEREAPEDMDAALAETERLTPGMTDAVTDSSGMHYSATVDLEYVIDGEFTLTLDSGESRVVRAGEAVIQCGANHSWANESDKPATMLLVFIGASLDESRFAAGD